MKAGTLGTAEAFQASDPDARIFGHGFIDRRARLLVLVTCGADLCTTAADALAIATLIHGRLDRLKK